MHAIIPIAALFGSALAVPAGGESPASAPDDRPTLLMEEAFRACRIGGVGGLVLQAEALAGLRNPSPCRPRPALALRIAQTLAGGSDPEAAHGYRLLSELHARGIAVPRDEAAAREHLRRAWMLRPSTAGIRPFADGRETETWLSRDESIAFLRRLASAPGMAPMRARLARALLLRNGSGDTAEADAILGDAIVLSLVRGAARRDVDADEARDDLAFFAQRRLAGDSPAAQRREAIAWLADAAFAPDSPHREAFYRAVEAANGGRAPATLGVDEAASIRARLRAAVRDIDYPPSAIRHQEQGNVSLRGLIDPGGRLIFTEPLGPGQPPRLVAELRRNLARRPPPPVEIAAPRATPYLWVELPTVAFRLPQD